MSRTRKPSGWRDGRASLLIRHRSSGSLYRQLIAAFSSNIESGVWPPDHRLPNEFELARDNGVSRTTVRSALGELEREGLVKRLPAKGTFVIGPKAETDLRSIQDLTLGLIKVTAASSHQVVKQWVTPASVGVAHQLRIPPGTNVVEVTRLRLEDNEPNMLVTFVIRADRVPGLEAHDLSLRSIYPFLDEAYSIKIRRAKTSLEPTAATGDEAELLKVYPGAPCMLIRRLLEDESGPVVSTKLLIRGDKCKYVISWWTDGDGTSAPNPAPS